MRAASPAGAGTIEPNTLVTSEAFNTAGSLPTAPAGRNNISNDGNLSLLQATLASLSNYLVGDQTLSATLHRVAELSMSALPASHARRHTRCSWTDQPTRRSSRTPKCRRSIRRSTAPGSGRAWTAFRRGRPVHHRFHARGRRLAGLSRFRCTATECSVRCPCR